ncbi:MAG: tyrosine-type recombinase/integrase [Thermoplasmata archaeon]
MSRRKKEKVWLTLEQVQILERNCTRLKDRCIIKLGTRAGLRANEIATAEVKDLREYNIVDEIEHFLKIEGKQTNQDKGEGKKKGREAFIPDELYTDLRMVINQHNLKNSDPLVPNRFGENYSVGGIRERVYSIAKRSYEETKDDDFLKVSSHDLRRFFAHHNLVEKGKNPRIIMAVGGWESWQAIEPYLDRPSKKNIVGELGSG